MTTSLHTISAATLPVPLTGFVGRGSMNAATHGDYTLYELTVPPDASELPSRWLGEGDARIALYVEGNAAGQLILARYRDEPYTEADVRTADEFAAGHVAGAVWLAHDEIAERLDAFGVSFIEGGWPGSNPKDVEFFERAKDIRWTNARITAFGSTRKANVAAEEDPQLVKLVEAGTRVCTIFGKTSTMHVTEILRTTLETNLEMIEDSLRFTPRIFSPVVATSTTPTWNGPRAPASTTYSRSDERRAPGRDITWNSPAANSPLITINHGARRSVRGENPGGAR